MVRELRGATRPNDSASATTGSTRLEGLAPVLIDKDKGRVFLQLLAPDADGGVSA